MAAAPAARRGRRAWAQLLALLILALGVGTAPAAEAATTCGAYRTYAAKTYCSVTVEGIKATAYGTGRLVYLDQTVVAASTSTTVTVRQDRVTSTACPVGMFCGQLLHVTSAYLTISWQGTSRPTTTGMSVIVYGSTRTGTIVPTGWERSGYCGDYC